MSEPIRVLHVIGIMDRGGAESMIMNLYRNIDRTKVQFDFVENSFEPAAYDDEILSLGGRIYRCPHFVGKNYIQYRSWWERFFLEHKGEYHIIHGHIGSCATIYLHIAKKHGLFTVAHSHSSFQSRKYKLAAYGTRFIADFFFGCSKESIADRYGERIASGDRSKVLLNAIDTSRFTFNEKVRKEVRDELGFRQDDFVIGQVGRFITLKNHEFTVDLFSLISKEKNDTKLLLVGEGPLREKIKAALDIVGLEDRCIFTGSRPDVNRLMQAMDVLVMPSIYEGLPVTLIEAQAAGLPCLVSDTVTRDADGSGLVSFIPLNDIEKWKHGLIQNGNKRSDTSQMIKAAGYDIDTTVEWLQRFYIEQYSKNS